MKTPISKDYGKALRVSLVFQVFFMLLAVLCLDYGQLLQIWCFSMTGFWGAFLLIVNRRPQSPTRGDLFFIRWGFPMIFPFGAMLVAGFIWKLRGVWW